MKDSELAKYITKAYVILGQPIPPEIDIVLGEVRNRIAGRYSDEEIEYVFTHGVRNKFTEVRKISAFEICQWFDKYVTMGIKEKLFPQKMIEEKNQPSEQEKEEMFYSGLCEKFNDFKKTGRFIDGGGSSYNYLDKKGKITFSMEKRLEFFEQAGHNVLLRYEGQGAGDKIKEIRKDMEANNCTLQKMEARYLALKSIFESLILTETTIQEFLNS